MVAVSVLYSDLATTGGLASKTTTSFTPADGSYVVVIAGSSDSSAGVTVGTTFTITDNTGGGPLAWSAIKDSGSPPSWGYGLRAWGVTIGTGVSMTVTCATGANISHGFGIVVLQFTDQNASPVGATGAATDATAGGSTGDVTLDASPASTSICVGAAFINMNSGDNTVTPGSSPAWTERFDGFDAGWSGMQVQTITGHTSTNVHWDNLSATGSGKDAVMIAFEVKAPSTAVSLTGVSATGSVGTLGFNADIALSGVAASGETGDLSRALSTLQVGSRIRSGSLNPGDKLFKLGRFARQRRNTATTPTITQALTGVAAVGEVGSVSVVRAAALSGLAASGVAGTLGPVARALEGSRKRNRGFPVGKGPYDFGRFATPRRNVNPAQTAVQSLAGVASTAAVGTVVPTRAVALTGVAAVGQVGSVSASQAGVVSLTGVGCTAGIGSMVPAVSIELTGVQAAGHVGTVSAVSGTAIELTGVQATGEVGNLAVHVARGLTGVSAVGFAGTMIGTTPGTWVPVNTEASVEGWTPIAPD